ncbi:hypothetical protein F5Y18DRAFT_429168 [Xylariaceae sp. FL1019]|nr:hypothetical protein F5Y18DRAFT_429168 [Xylariaceae sp. FL1019]
MPRCGPHHCRWAHEDPAAQLNQIQATLQQQQIRRVQQARRQSALEIRQNKVEMRLARLASLRMLLEDVFIPIFIGIVLGIVVDHLHKVFIIHCDGQYACLLKHAFIGSNRPDRDPKLCELDRTRPPAHKIQSLT